MQDPQEDRQHLQGVSPLFVHETDLLLRATEQDLIFEFPVHRALIAAHSPVLHQMLVDLESKALPLTAKINTHQQYHLQVPMVEDDCAAVRAVLAHIYSQFTVLDTPPPTGDSQRGNNDIVQLANQTALAHKYGMLAIMRAKEKALAKCLLKLLSSIQPGAGQPPCITPVLRDQVLECAGVATKCGFAMTLALCESVIAAKFDAFNDSQQALINSFSPSSMFRVAQGLVCYQRTMLSYDRYGSKTFPGIDVAKHLAASHHLLEKQIALIARFVRL